MVQPLFEPPQRFSGGRRPIIELESVVGAARSAGDRIHRHVFERMQRRKGRHAAADIGPGNDGGGDGSAREER